MVPAAVVNRRFDPAAHLSKQGWKGKGTALKHGHSTRPLPVVQKKTLSGIGKDRDEAVPFWDHIFASTAANLFCSTPTSTVVGAPKELAVPPPVHSADSVATARPRLSPSARMGREVARRGLYSRFYKGRTGTLSRDETVDIVEDDAMEAVVAEKLDKPTKRKDRGDERKEDGRENQRRMTRTNRADEEVRRIKHSGNAMKSASLERERKHGGKEGGSRKKKRRRKDEGGPGPSSGLDSIDQAALHGQQVVSMKGSRERRKAERGERVQGIGD